ncbi:MAG: beta-galactosidase [Proteiniphilum sp.]|jgi:beta-galactosidase|nr:beta-galactosidase [Proteiniphilum sp.]
MIRNRIAFLLILSQTLLLPARGRDVTSFNDGWSFKKGPFPERADLFGYSPADGGWQEVTLPHTWNARDMQTEMANASAFRNPQERFYTGESLYRKTFTPDASLKGKRLFLRFEGVGSVAEVYVNNRFAGRHKGAYSAFTVEITRLLKHGEENEIIVKVDNASRPDVLPVNNVLFGVYGGIYRDVQLITTGELHISLTDYASPGIYIRQRNVTGESAEASVKVKVENSLPVPQDIDIVCTLQDMAGRQVVRKVRRVTVLPQGRPDFTELLKVRKPRLWQGVDDPYLYRMVVQLVSQGTVIDEVVQPLGFRHFEFRAHDGMYLNGKKYPMYGVCRHQDWWEKGSALTAREHDADLALIREIGATTVRLAHYQQAEYFYAKCDSIGLLVWAEIPFVNQVTTYESENAVQQLTELIRQNFNHPSIYVWGLHNEVYAPFEQTIPLTTRLHDLAKSEDSDRYTVSVSGYNTVDAQANNNADLQGINHYFGWYGGKIGDIENWVAKAEKEFPHHKVIFSEYGGEANIHQQNEEVSEIGDCCGFDRKYYETWATKFHEIQWGVIAKHPYLLASYVWNMFDFATPLSAQGGVHSRNMKGLVTFDRKVKKDAFYWYKANWSREPVLYLTQRRADRRVNEYTPVTVYSNIGAPRLTVNGTEVTGYITGNTDVHYIFKDVPLKTGENIIEATIEKNDETYRDKIVWHYSPENRREEEVSSPQERKGMHTGL